MMEKVDRKLDVKGAVCPYPVVYALKELKRMEGGQVLEVLTDHMPSVENVPVATEKEGHEVLKVLKIDMGVWKILIRVKEA